MNDKTVAVLGGGSWGTVLANLSAERGFKTTLWMRDNEVVEQVNLEKQNSKYLPGYILSDNLLATNEIEAISSSDLVVFCIPSDSFRDIAQKAAPHIKSTSHLVTATKGVEENGFILMSHILSEIFGDERPIGVLSGHAAIALLLGISLTYIPKFPSNFFTKRIGSKLLQTGIVFLGGSISLPQ